MIATAVPLASEAVAEQVPRHGIGVCGGGDDEEPKIGGSEQLPGEFAARSADHGSRCVGVAIPGRGRAVAHQFTVPGCFRRFGAVTRATIR